MRRILTVSAQGGTIHTLSAEHLHDLQSVAEVYGSERFPTLLRLGRRGLVRLQPITARTLLGEVESLVPRLAQHLVPSLGLWDEAGTLVGGWHGLESGSKGLGNDSFRLTATEEGIRAVTTLFPPPVGFRSGARVEKGSYECYFVVLERQQGVWMGVRTPEMGGTGSPVPLPPVSFPPPAHWHSAGVASEPEVSKITWESLPGSEVFRDVLHALESASTEALRTKSPLQIRVE